MRNGTASQLLTNSFSGGQHTESMIHIRHYEENDESTAVGRVLSSARHKYSQHPKQAVKCATKMITHC